MLAAAHLSETCHADPDLLVSSPYIGAEHHLDLTSVPKNSKQLAIALQTFRPLVENYPSEPYSESFNWQEVIDQLPLDFSGTNPILDPDPVRGILLHRILLDSSSWR